MNACSFLLATSLQLQRYKDFSSSVAILKSQLQKILIQWPMGHSGDDVNHKKPHKMNMC